VEDAEAVTFNDSRRAKQALLDLCDGAAERAAIDTPDSWMMRAEGARLRSAAIEALNDDPETGPNIGQDRFLHVAGVSSGSGLEILDPWLRGLLHRVLVEPSFDRSMWGREVDHFLDVLAVRDGAVSCTIRSAFAGITLPETAFELDDGVVRPAVATDFFVPIGATAPDGIVLEYRTHLPAAAAPLGLSFPDELVAEVETAHQTRLTRFLLAVALSTEAPIQEQLVMKEIDFGGGGSGRAPEEAGPIVSFANFPLGKSAVEQIREVYAGFAGKELVRLGVATRRLLLARTERVRPADQIIDYAIALESMTSKRYGDKQGKELARLLASNEAEREALESDHERFRSAREAIVHDGVVPADSPSIAQTGRDLVGGSLRARSA
jgi:hypothetical protein